MNKKLILVVAGGLFGLVSLHADPVIINLQRLGKGGSLLGGLSAIESIGRYKSDMMDINRLSAPDRAGLKVPSNQRLYDRTVGGLRKVLPYVLQGVPTMGIQPLVKLIIDAKTRKYFNLNAKQRKAYLAGMATLSSHQKKKFKAVQKRLRTLARGRLVSQAIYSASLLPAGLILSGNSVYHDFLQNGRNVPVRGLIALAVAILGGAGGGIADAAFSIKLRGQYARWVKLMIKRGRKQLKKGFNIQEFEGSSDNPDDDDDLDLAKEERYLARLEKSLEKKYTAEQLEGAENASLKEHEPEVEG